MKQSHIVFFFFLLQVQIFAQWEDLSIMTNSPIESVDFFDDNKGYIVSGGKAYKTIDGAINWDLVFESNSAIILQDVYIIEEDLVIIVGKDFTTNHSLMYRSENGGNEWDYINISSSSILSEVFFPTPDIGFCVSLSGEIFKSKDSGATWNKQTQDESNNLISIYFINEFVGVAVGGSPFSNTILRTVDGGSVWYSVESPAFEYLQSVYFTSDEIGYIVGWQGQILKTIDGGQTWDLQSSVNMEGNLDVFFTDDNTGYVVGGNQPQSLIQRTTNGGEIWEDISPSFGGGLISIDFPSPNTGYAVGSIIDSMGTILKTESGGITSTQNIAHDTHINVYPNPFGDRLFINTLDEKVNLIRLYDSRGKIIKEINSAQQKVEFDASDLSPNNYYLEVHTDDDVTIKKIIKL